MHFLTYYGIYLTEDKQEERKKKRNVDFVHWDGKIFYSKNDNIQ